MQIDWTSAKYFTQPTSPIVRQTSAKLRKFSKVQQL